MASNERQWEFEEMFRGLYPRALTLTFRILGSVPAAEDAASEAFTRAFVAWPRIADLPYRDAWVLRVATNAALDVARRPDAIPPYAPQIEDPTDAADLRATLVEALTALSRRQREAIVLRHLAGYTSHETAIMMGLSDNSVKKHLQRGLERLRRTMPGDEGVSLGVV